MATPGSSTTTASDALRLTSPGFAPNTGIPSKYTCEGQDVSPPLTWEGVPASTRSLALIVEDPDAPDPRAPQRTWAHWVLYNLSPQAGGLEEGARRLPAGAREGLNDWKRTGYGGPCPPIGRHRYFFKLYALDTELGNLQHPTRDRLLSAMEGHILARTELMGTYEKSMG